MTITTKTARTEQVGGALNMMEDPKAKAMQHALADAVIARERASADETEASASLAAIRSDKPGAMAEVTGAALLLAAVGGGKRASELEAIFTTEMLAGIPQADAACSALGRLTGEVPEFLIHVVRKAEKIEADHETMLAKAAARLKSAQDEFRAAELRVQKVLKEAELLVHTNAPAGSQARSMLKRVYAKRIKPATTIPSLVPALTPAPVKAAS
jgi:hypothetical protein